MINYASMEDNMTVPAKMNYVMVEAQVRYWEDATINGEEDADGTLIPFRKNDLWCPVIRLSDGYVVNWPQDTTARIHYKVCDAGEYFLSTDGIQKEFKYQDCYVPNSVLCVGENGYGDYIIFKVKADGCIENWRKPFLNEEHWETV